MGAGSGGWHLHVICAACQAEDVFQGVLIDLAADAAERHGWTVDREALHAPAAERFAACPACH